MAEQKTVKLVAPDGTKVEVSEARAEVLKERGYKAASGSKTS